MELFGLFFSVYNFKLLGLVTYPKIFELNHDKVANQVRFIQFWSRLGARESSLSQF